MQQEKKKALLPTHPFDRVFVCARGEVDFCEYECALKYPPPELVDPFDPRRAKPPANVGLAAVILCEIKERDAMVAARAGDGLAHGLGTGTVTCGAQPQQRQQWE